MIREIINQRDCNLSPQILSLILLILENVIFPKEANKFLYIKINKLNLLS